MKNTFTLILINFMLILAFVAASQQSGIEKEVSLKEQQSKIEEIKFVNKEIERQIAKKSEAAKEISEIKPENPKPISKKELKINSDFTVTGGITATKFYSDSAQITGNTQIEKTLKSKIINTDKITTQTIVTDKILSNTGVLTIEADLIINNDVLADTVSMRGTSFVLEGVRQWGLVHHDDFESEKSLEGWSDKRTSKCNNSSNTFLGGHCHFSATEVTKTFTNLPKHEKLKVNAAFHMLDAWEGEYAYMKIDGIKVWNRRGEHSPTDGIDICGGESNDPAFNLPVEVTVPHSGSEITVSFGSTLTKDPCNQSFGIDDVMIYVR